MAEDDPLDPRRQDALGRYSETRRQEAEQSEIIEPPGRLLDRAAIYIGLALVLAALTVLAVGRIDVIVTVRGDVVPERELIAVQSRNTGVLADVAVSLGSSVTEGDVIARLGGAVAEADLVALARRIELQTAEAERLRAEVAATASLVNDFDSLAEGGADLAPFGDLVERVQALQLAQQDVRRRARLAGESMDSLRTLSAERIAALEATVAVRQANLDRLEAQRSTLLESITLREEQAERLESLIASGISTRSRALELRDRIVDARIALSAHDERMGAVALEIGEARLQIATLRQELADEADRRADALATARRTEAGARAAVSAFFTERRAALRALELEIDRARDELRFATQRAEARTIRAPASGTVASLRYAAPGPRVVEGEEIARIVPEGVPNILRAQLPGKDAGRVEIGQRALVKLDAFPFYRFGTVPAEVTALFPEPQGNGFGLRLDLSRQTVGEDPTSDPIEAGLAATVEIVTERRSLMSILLDRGRRAFTSDPIDPAASPTNAAATPAS